MTDQPNFTRIPNDILEAMPTLGNAELRVLLAIARKTVGWQKECDVISVSQIAGATGLTSRNAQNAIVALLDKGLIKRESAGKQSYCYTLSTISPRDTVEDHIPSEPISPRDTEPYPLGTRLTDSPYPLGTTQKKESKEKKERDSGRADRAPRTPRKKEEKTPAPIVTALADVCKIDQKLGTKEQKLQLYTLAKDFYQAGAAAGKTTDEIAETVRYVGKHWITTHWKGKKGDTPWPKDIRENWRAAIEARGNGSHLNGTIPKPAYVPPTDIKPPHEVAARMKELIAQQRNRE